MTISIKDLSSEVNMLDYKDFADLIASYSLANGFNPKKELKKASLKDLQLRLKDLNINRNCPQCDSSIIVNNGTRNDIQKYKCKDCSHQFTLFSGTILEKTRYHWNVWLKMLEMTLTHTSLDKMQNILIKDYGCSGINIKTVWRWRLKLIYALAHLPVPTLTGVIQIDETFERESQKGSRDLINFINNNEKRMPRYGRKSSKLGVMSAEFATVVVAVDNSGYSVIKTISQGKFDSEHFDNEFTQHFNNPSFVCTDNNSSYTKYCTDNGIRNYIKPSNYLQTLTSAGYTLKSDIDYSNPILAKSTEEKNNDIYRRLYKEGILDYIYPVGRIPFGEFQNLKKEYGLNISRVNEIHKDLKKYIDKDMTSVSTKYLDYYVRAFNYIRNWKVDNGTYPTSSKDAEKIFIEILKEKNNYTLSDIENAEFDLKKPSGRSHKLLEEKTEKARSVTGNVYFKFDEEDGVYSFNKRKYLETLKIYQLKKLAKPLKIRNYTTYTNPWSLIRLIEKHPDIEEAIFQYIHDNKFKQISDEDIEIIKSRRYRT